MAVRGRGAAGWEDAEGNLDNGPWKRTGARGWAQGDLKCGAARNLHPDGFYPLWTGSTGREVVFHRRARRATPADGPWSGSTALRRGGVHVVIPLHVIAIGAVRIPRIGTRHDQSGGPICGGRVRRWMRAIALDPQKARALTGRLNGARDWGIAGTQRRRRNHVYHLGRAGGAEGRI